ncbi:MAG: sigma 54-interacting transcriptional regulator [Thiolinea sp.]
MPANHDLAGRIYELKKQRGQLSGELVEVNCATLRGDNAMSALFGHVKGAFTGALSARRGLLREADRGCCSWMKSANWDWMNRPCCCVPLRTRPLFRSERTGRSAVISS